MSLVSKLSKFCLALCACVSFAAASRAVTTLTLDNCDSQGCRGADLTLSVESQGSDWVVTYTINTDNLNTANGKFTGLDQIGFLAVEDWTSATLLSAPNALGDWSTPIEAVVNSNGTLCATNSGDTDKVCSYAQNNFLDMSGGGNYSWQFKLTGGTLLDTSEWHFSGQWSNAVGSAKGNIISAGAAPIPEPSAALLFGVGALTVGRSLRRPLRRA